MFGYYLDLALRSLRRNKVLSALMMLAIALGIGASITMLTVLHNLSGNPLPQRSGVLFHPQVDPRPANLPGASKEPPDGLTYLDAVNLYQLGIAPRRAVMSANWLPTRLDAPDSPLAMRTDRATTADFFAMFDVPFVYGSAWSAQDDANHAQVVVLSKALNQKLFGGADSVGKTLVIATKTFRVVGVIGDWNPQPHFYDVDDVNDGGAFADAEQMYLPFFTWLNLPQDYGYGPMRCWGNDPNAGGHDPKAKQCTWAQFWVELDTAAQVDSYRSALKQYSEQQHQLGRFQRAPNVRLRGLLDWLDYKHVVPVTVRMQTWIAFGVLLICMINTVGLMVAKFLRKSGEIGVRRALGASGRAVFLQCLVEAGVVGVAGGLLGLPLAWIGLWMVRQQPVSFAASAHLDLSMLGAALLLALLATLGAGVWPAWRASRVAPALQVKSL
ncbi:ABC transporter permease [Rhodanobacter glycinis]|uniref:FtsX-like permease family protein n=1 Tax=Rhodanobacter glycinis TaxID=582702 RepID=A0A1I4A8S9_9GAMM|nr:ABC transporter permease [Rhodanobacter glycinis]QEE25551.1 FtsX-like permease family protein [Rhodanobacter glycinis]SFK52590.1 putative ABC transport system permease protein [Rhodanobacter glycinis]